MILFSFYYSIYVYNQNILYLRACWILFISLPKYPLLYISVIHALFQVFIIHAIAIYVIICNNISCPVLIVIAHDICTVLPNLQSTFNKYIIPLRLQNNLMSRYCIIIIFYVKKTPKLLTLKGTCNPDFMYFPLLLADLE